MILNIVFVYRNALLALTKMLMALMYIFALLALLTFFPTGQILYMCEVILTVVL